ncbi:MAG: hypothetical protein CBARDCOR_3569 [uncultured Caballeronia sp.]|nr:MAG: hypothetical protein CBARDCOR_3569 [uncultured Caballeronia sp.]
MRRRARFVALQVRSRAGSNMLNVLERATSLMFSSLVSSPFLMLLSFRCYL